MTDVSRTVLITNQRGLHARASAKFVECAEQFECDVTVSRDGQSVTGTSIMGLLMLGAGCGASIHIAAEGSDAAEALDALSGLVESKFGEV